MIAQATYKYSHSMGIYSLQGRGFNNPVDLAVGGNGVIYVVNRAGPEVAVRIPYKRISMCTVDEDYLGDFSTGGVGDGQIMWPASIAIDRDGNVYISDEALHRISIFDSQGRFLSKWGVRGYGDGEFDRPAGITFDNEDNLLVVDGLNCRIQKYKKDGTYIDGWGSKGSGNGEFNLPWGIATDGEDNVYVADWRNDRIQKFDTGGKHLSTFGESGDGDGQFNRPAGIDVDDEGNIYIADWGNERMQVLDSDGNFIAKLRGESGVSKWGQDYFEANKEEWEERQKADLEPELDPISDASQRERSAATEKLFWGPTSVKVDGEGRVYVVESCRHRIQIFQKILD